MAHLTFDRFCRSARPIFPADFPAGLFGRSHLEGGSEPFGCIVFSQSGSEALRKNKYSVFSVPFWLQNHKRFLQRVPCPAADSPGIEGKRPAHGVPRRGQKAAEGAAGAAARSKNETKPPKIFRIFLEIPPAPFQNGVLS